MKKSMLWSVGGVIVAGSAALAAWKLLPAGRSQDAEAAHEATEEAPTTLVLSAEKLANAEIRTAPVTRQVLQQLRTVPGRVDYNGVRRVELKATVEAVVREVLMKPGDPVRSGSRLASLDSSEIGLVRAEVEKCQAELRIANQAFEWAEEIATNLDELLKVLGGKPDPKAIEKAFEGKILGDHRQAIVSAYSRFVLAEELWADIQPLIQKGSIATQVAKQRETTRQVAKEDYLSVCEQSRFDARQAREKARANRDYARRLVDVSRQKLKALLGAFSEVADRDSEKSGEGVELTRFYLIAPIDGTIEQRMIAPTQRLSVGAPAFVVADTETLWVTADIRERDWQVLSVGEGDPLTVRVPALDGREFKAKVSYVGRMVDTESRAVPLIADLDNHDHALKPGMFAWVSLPAGATEEALVVPPTALQTHEGRQFVFVEEVPGTFRRTDVTAGTRTAEWVAIERGLEAGQIVVIHGAFLLKSELLLEREEE